MNVIKNIMKSGLSPVSGPRRRRGGGKLKPVLLFALFILLTLGVSYFMEAPVARAQEGEGIDTATQFAKLTAGDGALGDRFGNAVAVDGDVAVVGAYKDDGTNKDVGSAYVYRNSGGVWSQETKLEISGGGVGDCFGVDVAVSGDVVVVGAYGDGAGGIRSGAAYVFRYSGSAWAQEARLEAPDAAADDYAGKSVAIDGNVIVVGSPGDDDNGPRSGSANIYRYSGSAWNFESKVVAVDGDLRDGFGGDALDVSGETVLVGVHKRDDNGPDSGAAYVFKGNAGTWSQESKLTAFGSSANDRFGLYGALDGDYAVIGAPGDDERGFDAGAAYVFKRNVSTWNQEVKLFDEAGIQTSQFGSGVSIDGAGIIVGVLSESGGGTVNGAACFFVRDTTWKLSMRLAAGDGEPNECFGCRVALSGSTVFVAAPGDGDKGERAGAAYVYHDVVAGGGGDPAELQESAKLLASDGAADDRFGMYTAIDGNVAVVGAYQDDDNGNNSGSAYVYRYNGTNWVQEAKLLNSNGAAEDHYGMCVAVSGNVIVVGAYYNDVRGYSSGCAYAYRYNGSAWVEEQVLIPPDLAAGDFGGYGVSIDGNVIVMGCNGDDDKGSRSGSAHVFRYSGSTWVHEAKLLASDGSANDEYSLRAVSVSGDAILVGAYKEDGKGYDSGSAYVYRYNGSTWTEEAKLLASDGAAYDWFGTRVSLSGNAAVIGARQDGDNGSFSGSAYVFRYNGSAWVQEAKLTASDAAGNDLFGGNVYIEGNVIAVGASSNSEKGTKAGGLYIFQYANSTWTEVIKLTPSDIAANDQFGCNPGISGKNIIVGALDDNDKGANSGSAYIFKY